MTTRAELAELAQTPDGLRQIDAMAAPLVGLVPFPYLMPGAQPYTYAPKERIHVSETRPWSPTSSIADAWQLRTAMAARNWHTQDRLTDFGWERGNFGYSVWFEQWHGGDKECHHYHVRDASDAPLAITIAALLAVEKKEKA